MRTKKEIEYLLKAIDAFQRRLIVLSPDYEILAANIPIDELPDMETKGDFCYQYFYDRSSPCENCAVMAVKETLSPSLCPKPGSYIISGRIPCFYA